MEAWAKQMENVLCDKAMIPDQWWANILKWRQTNIEIYLDATICTKRISESIRMPHIYQRNIKIYLYAGNSKNTNTNNISGYFYSYIQIFILITDWRNFWKGLTQAFFEYNIILDFFLCIIYIYIFFFH